MIIKGKVSKITPMIEGVAITHITDKPVKNLGKMYKSLNEKEQIGEVMKECKMHLIYQADRNLGCCTCCFRE